ncbi:bifunctional diaminohydroxyphosphoribosylaminopyrimidine deaminase/5-amino-6-(5-phosphoribosylamino)uracil reductase RibD [Bartonella sp. W8097]|uniref:bifunctional diaminohydroxyphosphoribosylaminopyrimidine deaminase/5-amino-6-(5-phosphoribosylamino)uracil reductase RibD n=1 Tax=Bartonella apihabitans TaxID=2750929 RepID=UPI0018DC1E66|nr:bifunctional diaminohydroxyphosphoribosylaminopyrimidine deaminase/5-amino-6-(5-phosphoribosylamino)uracil reductase RibD [Bartonella apihabitans]MBI0021120.1 bifunctional diaminohydroxyphosphoribosylaminopyrimidine deaminase/5-amino-6-(5-phosphoribosylamino)uracil reductase RibD [Bartonella apihabitans]
MVDKIADCRFMAAAIRLASWHIGQTAENPSVGAIIVGSDGNTIVGHGVTAKGGRPHAETQALAMAGENARNGTAYVTLEPCSHYGKTPPCADALVNAGIKRVVIARLDPDKRVSGRGVKILENAGIIVETGILAGKAFEGLSAYLTTRQLSRPEVTLKMAISADNGIGIRGKQNVLISNELSRSVSHMMRAKNDAILIGIGTVLADNPELTCRLSGLEDRSPVRVVVDPELTIPLDCQLVATAKTVPTWVISRKNSSDAQKKIELQEKRVKLLECDGSKTITPEKILRILFENNISSVLIEGGAITARTFLDQKAVDKVVLFRSTIMLGDDRISAPDFKKYLADFTKIEQAEFGKDNYSEWRLRPECLPE